MCMSVSGRNEATELLCSALQMSSVMQIDGHKTAHRTNSSHDTRLLHIQAPLLASCTISVVSTGTYYLLRILSPLPSLSPLSNFSVSITRSCSSRLLLSRRRDSLNVCMCLHSLNTHLSQTWKEQSPKPMCACSGNKCKIQVRARTQSESNTGIIFVLYNMLPCGRDTKPVKQCVCAERNPLTTKTHRQV